MPLFPNLIEKLQILRFSRRNRESELNPAVRTAFSRFLFEYAQRIAISAELLGAQRAMTEPPRRGPPTCRPSRRAVPSQHACESSVLRSYIGVVAVAAALLAAALLAAALLAAAEQ